MNQLIKTNDQNIMEEVMIKGDLAQLTPQQRADYYSAVCQSMGVNPLTKPFQYIVLNRRLTLYATRTAADQLRKINGVSIDPPRIEYLDDVIVVTVSATDKDGRSDTDLGVVSFGHLKGDAKANAIMKAVTKAKRRVTLSICGLGWLDETEIETIPDARPVDVSADGEIVEAAQSQPLVYQNGGRVNMADRKEVVAFKSHVELEGRKPASRSQLRTWAGDVTDTSTAEEDTPTDEEE